MLTLFTLTVLSCAVQIKNQRWYGDAGDDGAVWFETLTNATGDVDKADWDKLRFGMVCSVAQNYADLKAVLEKLCHETNNCVYVEALNKFFFSRVDKWNLQKQF